MFFRHLLLLTMWDVVSRNVKLCFQLFWLRILLKLKQSDLCFFDFLQLQTQEENHTTQLENLKSELETMKSNNEELILKNAKLEKGKFVYSIRGYIQLGGGGHFD